MSDDLSDLLSDWPYDEDDELQVRRIEGADGREKLQVRSELGVMQMEALGRPDGRTPAGFPSLLDCLAEKAEAHRAQYGWYEGFELDADSCDGLRREAGQYYQRRIALMALEDYAAAMEDADHNLAILDLLRAFGREADDRTALERFRPMLVAHRARCEAMQYLDDDDTEAGLRALDRGLEELRLVFRQQDREDEFPDSPQRELLLQLREAVEQHHLIGQRHHLQLRLDQALRREDPDAAAQLRAELREMEWD
jgi:hypothetical protein